MGWGWNATVKGTQEKVQTHRRGKAPLFRRVRGGGVDHHRKLPVLSMHACLWALKELSGSDGGHGQQEPIH